MFVSLMHVVWVSGEVEFWGHQQGYLWDISKLLSKLAELHLDSDQYCLRKVLILANHIKESLEEKKTFKVFLKCTILQPRHLL